MVCIVYEGSQRRRRYREGKARSPCFLFSLIVVENDCVVVVMVVVVVHVGFF